jgi:hypothetical protein
VGLTCHWPASSTAVSDGWGTDIGKKSLQRAANSLLCRPGRMVITCPLANLGTKSRSPCSPSASAQKRTWSPSTATSVEEEPPWPRTPGPSAAASLSHARLGEADGDRSPRATYVPWGQTNLAMMNDVDMISFSLNARIN